VAQLFHFAFPEMGHGFIAIIALAAGAMMLIAIGILVLAAVRVARDHLRPAHREVFARSMPHARSAAHPVPAARKAAKTTAPERQAAHPRIRKGLEAVEF
jgi:hypothetical protein